MQVVNIHEAKTHLSRLVDEAARGNAFIIAKAGKPMVKVSPLPEGGASDVQRLGFMAGEVVVPDDFDAMGTEQIEDYFFNNQSPLP
ncbi:type II toxin-antitoxin system prevent-host-death family antitoxin [Desulfonatronum sp. SC1]|nr:type II toxin-antitoxin system prevent-host-death family antitoxin [Desulfonatronum sp. SC1]